MASISSEQALVDIALRHTLAASGIGTWRWDAASGLVYWDETLERLCGFEPGGFGGTFEAWRDTLHPDETEGILAVVDEAMANRGSYHFEHRSVWPDGTVRWLECRGRVTVDEHGEFTGTVGCAVDVTDRKHSERHRDELLARAETLSDRLDRLQGLSRKLAAAATVQEAADLTVELLTTPGITGTRSVWLLDAEGRALELVAAAGMTREELGRFAVVPLDSTLPGAEAFRTRRTVSSSTQREAEERYPDMQGVPRHNEGFAAVPLRTEDGCLGVLAAGFDSTLLDVDLDFLEAVAAHLVETLNRVRLAETVAERADEAELAAERERLYRERLEFLGHINDALRDAQTPSEIMVKVTRASVPRLGDWCTIYVLPEPGAKVPLIETAHADPNLVAYARQLQEEFPYDPTAPVGMPQVLRSGQTEFYPDITPDLVDGLPVDDERRDIVRQLAFRSAIIVPLIKDRKILGGLQFVMTDASRRYDEDDLALAEAVAARVASSLENRRLAERERMIATTLQDNLLPRTLPAIPRLDVAVRYWAAGESNDVGGDFYDLFKVDDASWAAVMGDVCGTGPAAASVTALARDTTRLCLRRGDDPATMLQWLNGEMIEQRPDSFLTVSVLQLRATDTGFRATVTCAGHPLPVLVPADGAPRLVGRPGTLIGVFDALDIRPVEVELSTGDTMVLYTDGVTDVSVPHQLTDDQLRGLIADAVASGDTSDAVAQRISGRLDDILPIRERQDDIALLVVRVDG